MVGLRRSLGPLTMPRSLRNLANGRAKARPAPLQPFAYQPETEALVASFTSVPTTRRKKSIDRFFRTVKNFPEGDPVWPKVIGFGKAMVDANGRIANWKDLSKPCAIVGAVTSSETQFTSTGGTVRSAYYLDDLPVNDWECSVYFTNTENLANSSPDFGARDATNGVTLGAKSSGTGTMTARAAGGSVTTLGTNKDWNSQGWHSVARKSSSEFEVYKGTVKKATVLQDAVAMPHILIDVFGQNQNGTHVASTSTASMWAIHRYLTAAQREVLQTAATRLHQTMTTGELDEYIPGVQPQFVADYDYLVVGAGMSGVCGAINFKRNGKSVCVITDDADIRLGGMSTGGLGYIDTYNLGNIRGLFRLLLRKCQVLEGKTTTDITMMPGTMERVVRSMFDPTKTDGQDIPVYWSTGIKSVQQDATGVTVTTHDGRVFRGKVWLDGGDHNSAALAAGITHTTIREAAGTGYNAYNGVRPPNNVFRDHAGNPMSIDPFVVPGDPSSGLIRGVHGYASDIVVGSASTKWQAFNYRLTMTKDPAIMIPFDPTPPVGYESADYEILLRQLALDPTITMSDLFKIDILMQTANDYIYDVNNKNGFSTDYLGTASRRYITGSYADKRAIALEHERYIRGLFYTLQYLNDPRVPAALRTAALGYGLVNTHYCDPDYSRGQRAFWPNRLYQREAPRMVSDYIGVAEDANKVDGTVPRNANTTVVFTYELDSHSCERLAYFNGTTWEIRNEGGMFIRSGGADQTTPLPYEVFVPKRSESTRGLVSFGASVDHGLNSGVRMEPTFALNGQSNSAALMLAVERGIDVQDVPYADLRARIQDTTYLFANEVVPYLPQVN